MASSWNKGTLAKTTDVMSSAITGDLGFGAVQSAIKSASRAVSAGEPTKEQLEFVQKLRKAMVFNSERR